MQVNLEMIYTRMQEKPLLHFLFIVETVQLPVQVYFRRIMRSPGNPDISLLEHWKNCWN